MFWTLCLADGASAQRRYKPDVVATIDPGATIPVRTTETINARESDGRVFSGVVDRAVRDRSGQVAIPAGSDVELVVRNTSDREVALDLDAITVNNRRYTVAAEDSITTSERRDGIGTNSRTGKYVGGGALLGAVVGAIAGGGKGAAIGAGAGAAAGAGAQVLTRGRSVSVPAESLLTFRLQQPLRTGFVDNGFMRDGRHYHPGYSTLPQATVDGGYTGNIRIGSDNNVTWQAPDHARVFVEVDDNPRKLFAEGQSGTQAAPWISEGHRYVFVLVDPNGNEIGRDQMDLRPGSGRRYNR